MGKTCRFYPSYLYLPFDLNQQFAVSSMFEILDNVMDWMKFIKTVLKCGWMDAFWEMPIF